MTLLLKKKLFNREEYYNLLLNKLRKNYNKSRNKFLKKILEYKYLKLLDKNGSSIPLRTKIGKNVIFPHGIKGIFISVGAKIGDNCVIFQQVTIGSNTVKDSKKIGSPTIGNNVYIGAGAKIIGNVKVGNNVRIGANCVVVNDIPDNATVVLEKPRIIIKENKINDNNFYMYDEVVNGNNS